MVPESAAVHLHTLVFPTSAAVVVAVAVEEAGTRSVEAEDRPAEADSRRSDTPAGVIRRAPRNLVESTCRRYPALAPVVLAIVMAVKGHVLQYLQLEGHIGRRSHLTRYWRPLRVRLETTMPRVYAVAANILVRVHRLVMYLCVHHARWV